MKNLILVLLIGMSAILNAQTFVNYSSGGIGILDSNLNNKDGVQGSIYLFSDWNGSGRVFCNNQEIFDVENLNFDIKNLKFVSKISEDSIFVFDKIYKVKVNERIFSNIKNNFYEALYSSKNSFVFLKKYILKIEPERHKITNTIIGPGKYEVESEYYIYENAELKNLVLNKKHVLDFLSSKNQLISSYVKQHKLSYSKEEDLIKIFKYFDSL